MSVTYDKLLGKVLLHDHKLEDISDYVSSSTPVNIVANATDESNGYITIQATALPLNIKVFKQGIYFYTGITLNSPTVGKITFTGGLTDGETVSTFK
jgi:hypothetical protein